MEKTQPHQQMLLGKLFIFMQKLKLDSCLSLFANMNSKWIKDLNKRPKTLNFFLIIFTFTHMCTLFEPAPPFRGRNCSALLFSDFVEEKT
jgi:hypothetical protein